MRLSQYPDVTSIRQTKKIEVMPGVHLDIQDLPPTYPDELQEALPEARPPVIGPLRGKGGIIERDDRGRPLLEYDYTDPEYVLAAAKRRTLALAFFVTEGVCPGQLEFDAQRGDDAPAYFEAVLAEMKEFGFGAGQVTKIADAVRELSGITSEDIEEASAGFSPPDGD